MQSTLPLGGYERGELVGKIIGRCTLGFGMTVGGDVVLKGHVETRNCMLLDVGVCCRWFGSAMLVNNPGMYTCVT